MGYPTKRVSMTDVHGEPQQGGYLPAEIWHAYMAAVTEGKPCAEFPAPKESISYQPFFGRFASTGRSSESESASGESSEKKGHDQKAGRTSRTHTGARRKARSHDPARHEPMNHTNRATAPPVEKHAPEPAPTGGAEPHP